jgi:hypothetical protein
MANEDQEDIDLLRPGHHPFHPDFFGHDFGLSCA